VKKLKSLVQYPILQYHPVPLILISLFAQTPVALCN